MDTSTTDPAGANPSTAARHSAHTPAAPLWLRRALMIAGGVCVFALVGSLITPQTSDARDDLRLYAGGAAAGHGRTMPVYTPEDSLGTLESREYVVHIRHALPAPLYTVCTPDGRVLRADMQADEVYREFPTLDLERLRFDPGRENDTGALMLMYPLD